MVNNNKLAKVREKIMKAMESGNLYEFANIPYLLDECIFIFNCLARDGEGFTISNEAKTWYEKQGFTCKEHAIHSHYVIT